MDCNLRRVTPEEMREIQLRMLNIFADFCEEHNLRYSLGGGTLLGAVRHKGFIPWDDDIDVMMPRPDYEYFLKNFDGKETNTKLSYYLHDKDHFWLFAKLYDLRTSTLGKDNEESVYIDIFPIDFFPDMETVDAMWKLRSILKLYNTRIIRKHNTASVVQLIWRRLLWETNLIENGYYCFWKYTHKKLHNLLMKTLTSCSIADSIYGGAVVGAYNEKELMDNHVFLEYTYLCFENKNYMCIKDYDAYLTQHYYDYMKLPEEKDRLMPHGITAYWL